MEGVTIEVKDNNGNVKEVKPINLVAGETQATFEFATPLGVDPKGVWTIAGITVDLDLQAKLDAVYDATNEVKLLAAIKALNLSDVNDDNITFYMDELDAVRDADNEAYVSKVDFTVADAQAIVTDGNKAALKGADEEAIVEAVNKAKTQVALLAALAPFDRVNTDWIAEYMLMGTMGFYNDVDTIQGEIDDTNDTELGVPLGVIATTGTTPVGKLKLDGTNNSIVKKDLNEAKTLVTAYMTPDGKGESTKADLLATIDIQLAIVKVLESETPAQLTSAMNGLSAVDAAYELNMENFKDANRQAYIDKFEATAAATSKNTIALINGLLVTVNKDQANKPIDAINDADTATKFLTALKGYSDVKYVADDNKAEYWTLKDEVVVVKSTANITKFDYSPTNATSFKINGITVALSADTTNIAGLVAAIGDLSAVDVAVDNDGDKLIFTSQKPIEFENTTPGDAASDLKIAEDTYGATKTSIQALVDNANLAAIQTASTADKVYAALVAYGNDIKDLSVNNKAQYLTDVATFITDKATVQLAVDASNIIELQKQTTSAAGVLAKLQIMTQVKNVKAENAKAYLDSVKDTSSGLGQTSITAIVGVGNVQALINAINAAQIEAASVKALNKAKTAGEVRTILTNLAVEGLIVPSSSGDVSEYINLTNADKLMVAKMFMNEDVNNNFGEYDETSVAVALGQIADDLVGNDGAGGIVDDFNKVRIAITDEFDDGSGSPEKVGTVKATDLLTVFADLVDVGYGAFDELSGTDKLLALGEFIESYPTNANGDEYVVGYTSMTALLNAVDAAIAGIQ